MNEASIRDYLVHRLDIISPNLTFVDKEHKLKNDFGTKGFVDILAKDEFENLVIIELKRSNQAARQAIHEINKYVGLVKRNYGRNDNEIRAIIVSTEWEELIVPFSEKKHNSDLQLEGYKLFLENGVPTNSEKIVPLKYREKRDIGSFHRIFNFAIEQDMKNANEVVSVQLKNIGINDFVIINLYKQHDVNYSYMQYIIIQNYSKEYFLSIAYNIQKNQQEEIKPYEEPYFLWFEEYEKYKHDEKRSSQFIQDNLQKYHQLILRKDDYDFSKLLQEFVLDQLEIKYDDYENSTPERFEHIVDFEKWIIKETIREGFFSDAIYAGKQFEKELRGYSGKSNIKFYEYFSLENKKKIQDIMKFYSRSLIYNREWKKEIEGLLKGLLSSNKSARVTMKIFNPQPIMRVLKNYLDYPNAEFFPRYEIFVDYTDNTNGLLYIGTLKWNGLKIKKISQQLCGKIRDSLAYYNSFYDFEITENLGLVYRTEIYEVQANELVKETDNNEPDFEKFTEDNSSMLKAIIKDCTKGMVFL